MDSSSPFLPSEPAAAAKTPAMPPTREEDPPYLRNDPGLACLTSQLGRINAQLRVDIFPTEFDATMGKKKSKATKNSSVLATTTSTTRTRSSTTKNPAFISAWELRNAATTSLGIQNLGNTCYLSASLQCLFSIPQFLHDLYNTYKTVGDSSREKLPLTQALLEVATAIGVLSPDDVPLISLQAAKNDLALAGNPTALKTLIDSLTNKFWGTQQHDAHEFTVTIVNLLDDELAVSTAPPSG